MIKGQLFILLIFCVHGLSFSSFDALYGTGVELWKLHLMLNGLKTIPDSAVKAFELFSGIDPRNQVIRNQVTEIHRHLVSIGGATDSYKKVINDSLNVIPSYDILILKDLNTFDSLVSSIDRSYAAFYSFLNRKDINSELLRDWAQQLDVDLTTKIMLMRSILLKKSDCQKLCRDNLLSRISTDGMRFYGDTCGHLQPISSILFRMFEIVIVTEMKTNLMIVFANVLQYFNNEGWRMLNTLASEAFRKQFADYVDAFSTEIDMAEALYMRACDPKDGAWIRDKDFYELEGTFQTMIFRYHWSYCKYDSCNAIWSDKKKKCSSQYYDERTGCSSAPSECAYLSAIEACVLEKGPYKFQYVNSTALGFLGHDSKCPGNGAYFLKDGTGWDYSYAACACNCYGSHNKISLSLVESNVAANKVITGLRFLRQNKILYIQPKQGKLSANGEIDRRGERWIPLSMSSQESEVVTIDRERKVFFLEDLTLPAKYVLTGIQFKEVTRSGVKGFTIQIFGRPFDLASGQLDLTSGRRMSKETWNPTAGKALGFHKVSSLRTTLPHKPNAPDIGYVELARSELRADFGQASLPFFDAVPIVTQPGSPLGGIGLFHKGVDGYAGFLSLRVFPLEYKQYFKDFSMKYIVDSKVTFNDSMIH